MSKACSECEHDTAERGKLSAVCKACLYARPEWKPKKEEPLDSYDMDWISRPHVLVFKRKVVVEISLEDGTTYCGVAKCGPDDEFDEDFGATLALARATAKYAAQVERDAKK